MDGLETTVYNKKCLGKKACLNYFYIMKVLDKVCIKGLFQTSKQHRNHMACFLRVGIIMHTCCSLIAWVAPSCLGHQALLFKSADDAEEKAVDKTPLQLILPIPLSDLSSSS